MFSHYANSHKGICIEYKLESNFLDKNIFYSDVGYRFDFKPSSVKELFTTKHKSWEYEKEGRFVSFSVDNFIDLKGKGEIKK